MKKVLLGLLSLSLLLVACEKDDDDNNSNGDTTKPVISLNTPVEDDEVTAGSTLHVDGNITDNSALSEMRIDIHFAGDGHSHGKTRSLEWDWDSTINISGREWDFHYDVPVPAEADSGVYHVLVYALDAAGNQGDFVSREIIVVPNSAAGNDAEAPVITVTAPSHTGEAEVHGGDLITVQGNVTDNDHLEELHIHLVRLDNNQIVDEVHVEHGNFDAANSHAFDVQLTVPTGLPMHSELELIIEATDEAGNTSHKHFDYHTH